MMNFALRVCVCARVRAHMHMHRIPNVLVSKVITSVCRLCYEEEETTSHIVFECEVLSWLIGGLIS
jgi:hypothetical protein